jgi:hypothetical protein
VLRGYTGNADLPRIASGLDAAIQSRAAAFHAAVSPDCMFWFAAALLVIFATVG